MVETDILIVGGGIAGLTAAAAFAAEGRRAICVDAAPASAGAGDSRTTAFLKPAAALLDEIGVWPRLAEVIAPLTEMRLIDAGGPENEARENARFEAGEIGEPPFGWNAPNAATRAALEAEITAKGGEIRHETRLAALIHRRDHVIATFSGGDAIRARLIIGADGRDSAVRRLLSIGARRWDYGQRALVFTVAHEAPHLGVSTEIHRSGGPFTLVPTTDGPDGPRSSIVWMERAAEAARLAALPHAAFEAAANARSLGVLGRLTLTSKIASWPMITLLADRLTAPRAALIAEAAHVMPPIGAQGLNTSLSDIAALIKATAGDDPGRDDALAAYARHWPALAARVAGIDALNRAAMAEAQVLRDLRHLGLSAINRMTPLRRTAMRLGMGQAR